MSSEILGELIPVGGGDPIPLAQPVLTLGRRESCDICLQFPNISGRHCELSYRDGYWYIRDLGSTNGIKVNGTRVFNRPLRPGDEISISSRTFAIQYELSANIREVLERILEEDDAFPKQSLLERAGLVKTPRSRGDD